MRFTHHSDSDVTQANQRIYHLLMFTALLLFATDPIGATDFETRQLSMPHTYGGIDSSMRILFADGTRLTAG